MYQFKEGDKVRVVNKFLQGAYSHYNNQWKGYWSSHMDKYVNSREIGEVMGESNEGILVKLKHSDGSNVRWHFPSDSLERVEDNEVSEEDITLKLTPAEANTLLCLMTLTEGDREYSLRKHILSISQKLQDKFTSNHEDLMEFTTHLQDDTIKIEFRNFNVVNEIKSVEKQIDNLKHKLEQLRGE